MLLVGSTESNRQQEDEALMTNLQSGLCHELTIPVDQQLTVPAVFPDVPAFQRMPPVLATVFMVGLIERACIELLSDRIAPDQRSVGTHVDVSHVSPTPVGSKVTAGVTLESIKGRRLRFHIRVWDEIELVGEGRHDRFIIDLNRFMEGLDRKAYSIAHNNEDGDRIRSGSNES